MVHINIGNWKGVLMKNQSPLDNGTANNLRFLIGIRHEIEHQKNR